MNVRFALARMAMPRMSRTLVVAARAETFRRMVVLALGIKEFELAHGTAPADLDQLVPGILPRLPVDPMSGGPFKYRVTEGKWLLYSVGEDGEDDGGDPTPAKAGEKPGLWEGRDAVWPRPAGSGPGDREGK